MTDGEVQLTLFPSTSYVFGSDSADFLCMKNRASRTVCGSETDCGHG